MESKLFHKLHIRVQWSLCIAGKHVVVHIDGATVVDGITKSLSHDLHAAVHGQAQLEEACLRGGQGIHTLKHNSEVHVKGITQRQGIYTLKYNSEVHVKDITHGQGISTLKYNSEVHVNSKGYHTWARNLYPEMQQ